MPILAALLPILGPLLGDALRSVLPEDPAKAAQAQQKITQALIARATHVRNLRAAGQPTVPTTIAMERAENPFMRAADVARLTAIRTAKDSFR